MATDPMLYPGVLRYFQRQHGIDPDAPAEPPMRGTRPFARDLSHGAPVAAIIPYEAEFPGCSTAAPPWTDAAPLTYRTVANTATVGARGPARRRVLIATAGRRFAHYMPTTATWETITTNNPSRSRQEA